MRVLPRLDGIDRIVERTAVATIILPACKDPAFATNAKTGPRAVTARNAKRAVTGTLRRRLVARSATATSTGTKIKASVIDKPEYASAAITRKETCASVARRATTVIQEMVGCAITAVCREVCSETKELADMDSAVDTRSYRYGKVIPENRQRESVFG